MSSARTMYRMKVSEIIDSAPTAHESCLDAVEATYVGSLKHEEFLKFPVQLQLE